MASVSKPRKFFSFDPQSRPNPPLESQGYAPDLLLEQCRIIITRPSNWPPRFFSVEITVGVTSFTGRVTVPPQPPPIFTLLCKNLPMPYLHGALAFVCFNFLFYYILWLRHYVCTVPARIFWIKLCYYILCSCRHITKCQMLFNYLEIWQSCVILYATTPQFWRG